jgi:hypothetical protein
MADAPDLAVATILQTKGVGTVGTTIFRGPVRPVGAGIPHKAAFCLATGGPAPLTHDAGNAGPDILRASVQVRIRGNVGDYANGVAFARAVWFALQRATYTGYMSVICQESEPIYLGRDDTEHDEWSVNVATMREEG